MKLMGFIMVIIITANSFAKDLGKHGATFQIKEQNIVEYIKDRLKTLDEAGKLGELQNKAMQKLKSRLENPVPLSDVINTKTPREFHYDPTYVLQEDIKDHKQNILYKAGYALNPLTMASFGQDMIFINGQNQKQIDWASKYSSERGVKVVLVRGSPVKCQKYFTDKIYFDHAGHLTKKLGIKQVPAIVSQDGMMLSIQELKVDKTFNAQGKMSINQ